MQVVLRETGTVEDAEHDCSQVVFGDLLFYPSEKISFRTHFTELSQRSFFFVLGMTNRREEGLLIRNRELGSQRSQTVLYHSVLILNSETFILLFIDSYQQLSGIYHSFSTIPVTKGSHCFLVLYEIRKAAKRHFSVNAITLLQKFQHNIKTFTIEEKRLASAATENCIP